MQAQHLKPRRLSSAPILSPLACSSIPQSPSRWARRSRPSGNPERNSGANVYLRHRPPRPDSPSVAAIVDSLPVGPGLLPTRTIPLTPFNNCSQWSTMP
ncbi:hypothetical protein NDU88_011142 [Pleurodeles waltl]|uniref:Uncharacterized protein n=1 Tax=Pleurodeles waltl TaxID=8319 RepID=A0AAV7QXS3_PLEWA|nr:hypothetical protein NDU88_011142 [Pleurodeles waltl]